MSRSKLLRLVHDNQVSYYKPSFKRIFFLREELDNARLQNNENYKANDLAFDYIDSLKTKK